MLWEKRGNDRAINADKEQVLIGGPGINDGVEWEWKRDVLPSTRMPRWASRMALEINEVKVQRVQESSLLDIMAEGIHPTIDYIAEYYSYYEQLWDEVNSKYPWDSNPYTWVLSVVGAERG